MQTLERNIINLHGEAGKSWLQSLPAMVERLCQRWQLTDIRPVTNMSWNFVALAMQDSQLPVVLKISFEAKAIQDECDALNYFDGKGAIKVLDLDTEFHALLLEQAIPGHSLKACHSIKFEDRITIYANVVKQLSAHDIPIKTHIHVSHWCKAIDRIHDPRITKHFVEKAQRLRATLLRNPQREYLCHGDLHLENIIQRGTDWVAIDPKGIIGEMAFEAAAFDLLSRDEIKALNANALLVERITQLANALTIDYDRLVAWIFLRIIISAQWFVEDNGDPSYMLELADYVYSIA